MHEFKGVVRIKPSLQKQQIQQAPQSRFINLHLSTITPEVINGLPSTVEEENT